MTIRTNDFFPPAGPAPGTNLSLALIFNIGLVFGTIITYTSSVVVG